MDEWPPVVMFYVWAGLVTLWILGPRLGWWAVASRPSLAVMFASFGALAGFFIAGVLSS